MISICSFVRELFCCYQVVHVFVHLQKHVLLMMSECLMRLNVTNRHGKGGEGDTDPKKEDC